MRFVLYVAALAGALSLQGCWFVFIPGSVMAKASDSITGADGDHCVGANAQVGDRITIGGVQWKVRTLSGASSRCTQPQYPIRARLDPI